MPFDYHSFIQGVATGLKLGRLSPWRPTPPPVPPTPPLPTDYMITEIDEDRMITESGDYMVTE